VNKSCIYKNRAAGVDDDVECLSLSVIRSQTSSASWRHQWVTSLSVTSSLTSGVQCTGRCCYS